MSNLSNLDAILNSVSNEVLVSNSGQRKESIYKKEIFKDVISDRDKKTMRRKLRNMLDAFLSSYLTYEKQVDKAQLKKCAMQFDAYYKQVYASNDYSINSIASNNTEINKKTGLTKMMQSFSAIVKSEITIKTDIKEKTDKKK